jgi:hypothetical protein
MKLKTLRKKIRRLEKRLREGPTKLVKLKRNLEAMEAEKKAAARARGTRNVKSSERGGSPSARKKVKRKLNLSPERRAQLAAAMKARWAAKRATAETNPQPVLIVQVPALEETPQAPEIRPESV